MTIKIHPAAVVDPSARIGDGVEIGPGAIVEADTEIGEGCRLMPYSVVRRYTAMGRSNVVHPFAVLGGEPQDYGHDPSVRSFLRIGDHNVFREGATANRATGADNVTVIGDHNYLMTAAHVGHNARVGSHCILTNGAALGGYVEVQDRAILSAHAAVHQFCWYGEMAMCRGNVGITQHVPPFCLVGKFNLIVGLNTVGLRRAAHLNDEDRGQIHSAYDLLYRSGLTTSRALEEMDAHAEWGHAADKFRQFVRRVLQAEGKYRRGLCTAHAPRR